MKRNQSVEEKRIRNIVNRKLIILCIIFLVFIEIGYLYSFFCVPQVYQSTSRILLIPEVTSEVEKSSLKASARPTSMNVYRKRVTQSDILKQVIQNLELDKTEKELTEQIQVKVEKDTYILAIRVTDRNPEQAMKIAQETANVFLNKMKETYHFEQTGIVDGAKLPTKSSNTHYQHMLVFGALGVLVSALYIAVVYHLDDTIKTEKEIEDYTNLPLLGVIPKESKTEDWARKVYQNIGMYNKKKKAKTFIFTSMMPQEGTTFTAVNVAVACAKEEQKVLLIDCNMRKEEQTFAFSVKGSKGLTEYADAITGTPSKDFNLAKKYIQETKIANLHVLTNGSLPQDPTDFLSSIRMKRILAIAKYLYDIVLIDLPDCIEDEEEMNDYLILTPVVDTVILIIKTGETKIREIQKCRNEIENAEGNVFGCIVNNRETILDEVLLEEKNEEKEDEMLTVAGVVKEANKRFKKEKNPEAIFPSGEIVPKANREESKQQTEKLLEQVEGFEESIDASMQDTVTKLVSQKLELFETLQRARMANRQKKQVTEGQEAEQEKIEQDFLELKNSMKKQIQKEVSNRFQANLEELEDWNEEWLDSLTIRQKEALMKKLEKKEEAIQRRLQKEMMQYLQTKMKENKQPGKRGRKKKVPTNDEEKKEA